MGKSKTGGTRSYIRGRVGSDVYSIGRDAKGKKQQVVRSLAETVANPQTVSQMRGRMIMSTIMQVVAVLKPIIDHSFDNVSGKQPNISEFIARNYALVKADVAANPAANNNFGLVLYGEKGAKRGAYVISDGTAQLPSALALTASSGVVTITLPSDNVTIGGIKAALGMTDEEYFTLVGIKANGAAAYERFRVNPLLDDAEALTADNIGTAFATEGNAQAAIAIADNVITITLSAIATCAAVIASFKTASGWSHNKAILSGGNGFDYNANVALPTYPVGGADYLNGGDILGNSEDFNGAEPSTPETVTTPSTISGVTIGGAAVAQNASKEVTAGSVAVVATVTPGDDGKTYSIGLVNEANAVPGAAVDAGAQHALTNNQASFSFNAQANDPAKAIVLVESNKVVSKWCTITVSDDEDIPGGGGQG